MSLAITKPSIDIGIVCNDIDAMMTFYGETLGLPLEATIPMPGGGKMNRFKVGDSVIKGDRTRPRACGPSRARRHSWRDRLSLLDYRSE